MLKPFFGLYLEAMAARLIVIMLNVLNVDFDLIFFVRQVTTAWTVVYLGVFIENIIRIFCGRLLNIGRDFSLASDKAEGEEQYQD